MDPTIRVPRIRYLRKSFPFQDIPSSAPVATALGRQIDQHLEIQ